MSILKDPHVISLISSPPASQDPSSEDEDEDIPLASRPLRTPIKRAPSPTVHTSAPPKMQRSKDDASVARLHYKPSAASWQRSRSHQVIGLSPAPPQPPPKRRTILSLFPRELVFVILGHLHFDDIRTLLKADRRLRPFVHLRSFAPWRKQLALLQFHERKYDEMVRQRGDAVYRTGGSQLPEPSMLADSQLQGAATSAVEAAFLESYVGSLRALKLDRAPTSPAGLAATIGRAFGAGGGLSARLVRFANELLLGESRASEAFAIFDSLAAVEVLSAVRLYLHLVRISRGFTQEGPSEPSQTAHFLDADCRDAVRAFFAPHHRRVGDGAFQLTDEQARFVERDVCVGQVIKVQAFAGTGKTRSLVAYASARPRQRFLYIAFNTHAAADARFRFPSNVDCRTMHSVCLSQVQRAPNQKLGNIKPRDVVSLFDQQLPKGQRTVRPPPTSDATRDPRLTDTAVASYVLRTMHQYMYSDDVDFDVARHVPKQMLRETDLPAERVLRLAEELWRAVQRGKTDDGRAVPCPHDAYVKMLQLTRAQDSDAFFKAYHVLLLDEAQDLSAAQVCILLRARRTCGILVVGDVHQKIYGFRGGTAKAFNDHAYPPTATFRLTQSFRFGDSVARVASKILGLKAPAPWQERADRLWLSGVKGGDDHVYALRPSFDAEQGVVAAVAMATSQRPSRTAVASVHEPGHRDGEDGGGAAARARSGSGAGPGMPKHTQIFRSNKCLVEAALVFGVSLSEPHRIYLKTSQSLNQTSVVTLLRDGHALFTQRNGAMSKGSLLREFSSWKELVERVEAEESGGDGMLGLVASLGEVFAAEDFLARLESMQSRFSVHEGDASVVLTTCHQSKGLEWERVVVADDFRPALAAGRGRMEVGSLWLQDELNLMYVAVTRAKRELVVSGAVLEWLAALDGAARYGKRRMGTMQRCAMCGEGERVGVVRRWRMEERAVLLPPPSPFPSATSPSSSSGSGGGVEEALGCLACLDKHRLELDEDLREFLDVYHRPPCPPCPANSASEAKRKVGGEGLPLLKHPQRQACWDRNKVEFVDTVQSWLMARRFGHTL